MKIEDFFKTYIFLFWNRKKNIIIKKKTSIKKTFLDDKNLFGNNNEIKNSQIGFGTYLGSNMKITNWKIGKYCSIASNLKIICGSHPVGKNISTHPAFYFKHNKELNELDLSYIKENKYNDSVKIDNKWDIIIENDVWIGSDVKFLQGIRIGDGAVVGAGALVTKDVAPYAIVGGVPAKLIRKRFSDEDIEFLLELKWWDKGEEWIKENAEYFEDIDILKSKSQK